LTLRLLDLFSGIGGFSYAAERLVGGYETVQFVEQNPFCQSILRKHWPDVPIHDDVCTLNPELLLDRLAKEYWDEQVAGKPKKLSAEGLLGAARLYDAGYSVAELAAIYGVSRQGLWERLRAVTTMRPQLRHGPSNHFWRGGPRARDYIHNLTETAIQQGILSRQPCEICGASGAFSDGRSEVQAHHDDYNKPLEVRWLCQRHHHEWHKRNTPVERMEPPGVDVIAGGFP
jgi:hypothetical protein